METTLTNLSINTIEMASYLVIISWKCIIVATLISTGQTTPYTWEQILKVLNQPAVGANRIANELKKKYERSTATLN